jgi:ribonuclease HII
MRCSGRREREIREQGFALVAGVDEVGRGCLLGPVFAAAVILPEKHRLRGLNDSKLVPVDQRNLLQQAIQKQAIAWSVAQASVEEIDQINILQASRLAMKRAVQSLAQLPDFLLVDAVSIDLPCPQEAIIKGDAKCQCIAAASILAKTARDAFLVELGSRYPGFGLERNKGYGTPEHLRGLAALGPTPEHRRSFLPVQQYCLEF